MDSILVQIADSTSHHGQHFVGYVGALSWWQFVKIFVYGFFVGVGLRFLFKCPAPGLQAFWTYLNANAKEVLKAGLCWLVVFGLWVTAPQWASDKLDKFKHFYSDRYWAPLVAWLADSIVGNLLVFLQSLLQRFNDLVRGGLPKNGAGGVPPSPVEPPKP